MSTLSFNDVGLVAQQSDQFPYGWRYVTETLPNGEESYYEVPLTAEDLLDPQLGDQVVQNSKHQQSNNALFNMLSNHYEDDPTIAVFSDLKMRWKIPGLKEPAPDIAVVPFIKDKEATRSSFDVVDEGTRPCLVVEIMSEGYPGDDTEKVKIYEQAGVKEYFIINPHSNEPYYEILGYRLISSGKYQQIKPDKQGRLLSETTQIWFEPSENRRRLKLRDALTDNELLTPGQEKAARIEANIKAQAETKARIEETKARIEAETKMLEAETKMLEAEARAQQLEQRLQNLKIKSSPT